MSARLLRFLSAPVADVDELRILEKIRELHARQPVRVRLLEVIVSDMLRESDERRDATP